MIRCVVAGECSPEPSKQVLVRRIVCRQHSFGASEWSAEISSTVLVSLIRLSDITFYHLEDYLMSVARDEEDYCVTCPKCGLVIQRSFTTDSIIKCSRCKFEFYAYINSGVAIALDAAKLEGTRSRRMLLTYAKALSKLKEAPGTD